MLTVILGAGIGALASDEHRLRGALIGAGVGVAVDALLLGGMFAAMLKMAPKQPGVGPARPVATVPITASMPVVPPTP